MIRLITLCALLLPAVAQAAYLAPALETQDPSQSFTAVFEGETEGQTGFAVAVRAAQFGETERRVQSCASLLQARDEGFTSIGDNTTPFYDEWLWVRCDALDQLRGAPAQTTAPAPLEPELVELLPALVSERAACDARIAALKAALNEVTWLDFEGTHQETKKEAKKAASWRAQPPVQFDLIAAGGQENKVLAVSAQSPDKLRLYLNGATGALERLAQLDRDGDGIEDLLIHLSWESPVFGLYRRQVLWLKGAKEGAPYTLLNPQLALRDTMAQCPDHISDVTSGPAALQN